MISGAVTPQFTDEQQAILDRVGVQVVAVTDQPSESAVVDVDGYYGRYFTEHGISALLYRPDFYTFGAATTLGQLGELVTQIGRQVPAAAKVAVV